MLLWEIWMIKNWFRKVITKPEKTRNKIKRTIDNYEKVQIVRITNHIQHLKNSDYIIYKPPTGLQKGIIKKYRKLKQSYWTIGQPLHGTSDRDKTRRWYV